MAILGELDRAGLLDTSVHRIDYPDLKSAIAANDILSATASEEAKARALAAPGGKFNLELGSQDNTYPEADTDRKQGCIRLFFGSSKNLPLFYVRNSYVPYFVQLLAA